ncbi:peptidoglycan-binding domain-containing protein [Kitasatospora sp. NPDC097691]|uniref:peptidoglycan-binding domain-containing protein n=1 Tax=Kitasatospora sp. NPDC097691 TaxID=3157231 RepID=UPI0033288590
MTSPLPIAQGDEGPSVVALQVALAALGIYSGESSGVFDESTHEAVMQFQSGSGLDPAGVVDSETWSALGSQPFESSEITQLPEDEFPAAARVLETPDDPDAYLELLGIDPSGLDDDVA